MGKKKHQFINKKSSHKFNVVHRSQRDPLQPDEESSQHVLVPVGGICEEGAGPSSQPEEQDEHVKYGIYYDDDYDYLQHLRPRGEGMFISAEEPDKPDPASRDDSYLSLNLPAEVLPSAYEEDIGMLNKGVLPRGPQPDWDPDIVAALDDGVDFDDPDMVLEDDFITLAGAEGDCKDCDSLNMDGSSGAFDDGSYQHKTNDMGMDGSEKEWETDSDVSSTANLGDLSDSESEFSDEDTKSRFTSYSMTSSVICRTEGLKILDDHFERIMEEYDEEEIGPIDHEETTGTFNVNNDLVSQIVDQFMDAQKTFQLSENVNDEQLDVDDMDEYAENDNQLFEELEKKPSEKWDCESIISTYSNLYNHPKIIDEPKVINLHKRTGVPLGVFEHNTTQDNKTDEVEEIRETVVLNNIRNKEESSEDRKLRKQCVKDERRKRRVEKKENKMVFKDEHLKQGMIVMNKAKQMGIKM